MVVDGTAVGPVTVAGPADGNQVYHPVIQIPNIFLPSSWEHSRIAFWFAMNPSFVIV